MNPTPVNVYRA